MEWQLEFEIENFPSNELSHTLPWEYTETEGEGERSRERKIDVHTSMKCVNPWMWTTVRRCNSKRQRRKTGNCAFAVIRLSLLNSANKTNVYVTRSRRAIPAACRFHGAKLRNIWAWARWPTENQNHVERCTRSSTWWNGIDRPERTVSFYFLFVLGSNGAVRTCETFRPNWMGANSQA